MITKGERTELRSIVRQQFKVLRAEVLQRQAEMGAEVEDEITAKYAETDRTWENVTFQVREAVLACNRAINDVLYQAGYQSKEGTERMWIHEPMLEKPVRERQQLRHAAGARIAAQVKGALLRLDREEADLLRTLAIGALDSEEAHAFLGKIPTVGELVSSARLTELEQAMGDSPDA